MPAMDVLTDGDNCWPELREKGFITGKWVGIARLSNGTALGNSTVTVRIELPDGRTVLAETTLRLLSMAMVAFSAAENREGWG